MAARKVNRPVKLEVTRQQMFTSNGYRARTVQKLKLAADRDGKLLAIRHDGLSQTSQPSTGSSRRRWAWSRGCLRVRQYRDNASFGQCQSGTADVHARAR